MRSSGKSCSLCVSVVCFPTLIKSNLQTKKAPTGHGLALSGKLYPRSCGGLFLGPLPALLVFSILVESLVNLLACMP